MVIINTFLWAIFLLFLYKLVLSFLSIVIKKENKLKKWMNNYQITYIKNVFLTFLMYLTLFIFSLILKATTDKEGVGLNLLYSKISPIMQIPIFSFTLIKIIWFLNKNNSKAKKFIL